MQLLHNSAINQYLDPILIAFLVVLRIKNIKMFEEVVAGQAGPEQVMDYIRALPGGASFANSRFGIIIETYLLIGDGDEQRKDTRIANLKAAAEGQESTPKTSHAQDILRAMQYIPQGSISRYHFSISGVAKKVEMASALNS